MGLKGDAAMQMALHGLDTKRQAAIDKKNEIFLENLRLAEEEAAEIASAAAVKKKVSLLSDKFHSH